MRKSSVSELHGEWSEFADECICLSLLAETVWRAVDKHKTAGSKRPLTGSFLHLSTLVAGEAKESVKTGLR
jgi:hypothetical protein